MIASFLHKLRRLATDQSGNATVEFVIWFPVYLFLLVAGLEMVVLDPNNWVDPAAPTCTDTIAPVAPLHRFTNGVSERVVLLRACAQYRPYLPLSSFGQAMTDGNDGWARVTATSAYVQAQ